MNTSVASASSRSPSGRASRTPTPSLADRNTPSSLSSPSTADTREQGLCIRHGMLPTYTYHLSGPIHTVIFQPETQESVVLCGQSCAMFTRGKSRGRQPLVTGRRGGGVDGGRRRGGRVKGEGRTGLEGGGEDVFKLLYASEYNVYVGICRNTVKLFNAQFECYYEIATQREITSGVYNACSGEIITGSQGNITIWMFRQGGKEVAPSQIIQDGLQDGLDGEVSVLHMEDVPGRAQRCFAAVDCGVKVYQLCSGRLLSSHSSLHHCPLTALLFFRPLRLLVSSDCDGAIKVWDSSWRLCCTFIGHQEAVTSLSPYPSGPLVISGSLDTTLRVWDLKSHDQVECINNGAPVTCVHSSPGTPHLLTHSHSVVRGWRVQQLYKRSTVVGREITSLTATTHPLVPTRLLAACKDSAVRLVCPVGGHVISTALLPTSTVITSLVYFPLIECLYVLDEDGVVSVFDGSKNPCTQTGHWTAPHDTGHFTCLAQYEQTMDEDGIEEMLAGDRWLAVVLEARNLSRLARLNKDPLMVQREGMSLLLAGTNEGHIALLNHTTGDIQFSLKVHSGPVSLLAANPRENLVISASNDCQIHVLQLYPHIQEALSLLMSFDVTSCPSLLSVTQDRVGVACNDHAHSSYTIDMFCLQDKVSFTGVPENSHQAAITALTPFPRLQLFASTSLDRTLRIWTANNHPVRVLQLDGSPRAMTFSSLTAHITIALHRHLHCIEPSTYLPDQLLNQLVSMPTNTDVEEQLPCEMTSDLSTLTPEDQQRLQVIDDTIQQDSYKGALSVEEMEELEETAREKAMGISLLLARDNEIKGIRDGTILATRKRAGLRAGDRERAWHEVLSLLHPHSRLTPIVIPEEDDFDADTYGQSKPVVEPYSRYQKGPHLSFFPPLATFEPPYPIAPDGVLPNSALLQLLRKSEADQAMADSWTPPVLSDQQRRLVAEMEEEEEIVEDDSDVLSQLQAALDADFTSPPPSLSPTPPPTPPPEPARRKIVPLKMEKLIAPPPPPKPPTLPPRIPTPPPPKSPSPPPTPPPPPTPLPEYISQFLGRPWFDKLYPNANSSTFPRPWSVTRFIMSLLSHLSKFSVDSYTKADICQAILCLLRSYNPSNTEDIHKTVLELLTTPPHPSLLTPSHRPLVTSALDLLYHLNIISPSLVIVGMVMSVEERGGGGERGGDVERWLVAWLEGNGVVDPHGYFTRQLATMAHTQQSGLELHGSVEQWLESWAQQMMNQQHSKSKPHRQSQPAPHKTNRGKKSTKQKGTMKGASPLMTCDVIDVINYFIRVEHENELARRRVVTPPPATPPDSEEELPHNTVLTLPNITRSRRVVRLGETHCSCCHPERETTLTLVNRLPPVHRASHSGDVWTGFSRTISLAMRPQSINPFLTDEEQEAESSHLAPPTLASLMKYFVPGRSIVTNQQS